MMRVVIAFNIQRRWYLRLRVFSSAFICGDKRRNEITTKFNVSSVLIVTENTDSCACNTGRWGMYYIQSFFLIYVSDNSTDDITYHYFLVFQTTEIQATDHIRLLTLTTKGVSHTTACNKRVNLAITFWHLSLVVFYWSGVLLFLFVFLRRKEKDELLNGQIAFFHPVWWRRTTLQHTVTSVFFYSVWWKHILQHSTTLQYTATQYNIL